MPPRVRINIDRSELSSQVAAHLSIFATDLTRRMADQARQAAPVRSGRLVRSIQADPVVFRGRLRVETGVSATADYALYVHEGTRAHTIRARRARALRFQVGGRIVFARSVQHPGTRSNPFLREAAIRVIASDSRIDA